MYTRISKVLINFVESIMTNKKGEKKAQRYFRKNIASLLSFF